MAGCFRHCGRDNPHRGAAGWAYAYFWRLWIWNRNFQLLGSCVSDIGRWFLSRNLTNWRQPVAHAQPFRGQFRCCQQPAAVLCWPLCDPRLSSGRRGVEGCGRVFPALSARRHSRKHRSPAINTSRGTQRQRTPLASLGLAEPQILIYRPSLTSRTATVPITPVVGHIHQLWVVASHTPTRYLDYPAILRVYPHTTRWP